MKSGDDTFAQAVAAFRSGDALEARRLFALVLADDPTNAIAAHQLGLIAFTQGDPETAIVFLRQAVLHDPSDPEYHNNLGVVLNASGDHFGAQDAFLGAIAQNPVYLQAILNLGAARAAGGDELGAIVTLRFAVQIDPGSVEARDALDAACARTAPPWHFPMMADAVRNAAYDAALRRAAPGKRVLDIGSGAGLLAMMAARAGASRVDTCEMVEPVAFTAHKIIETNGLSDRITLHARRSDLIEVGADMPERAELLVTETFASGVLSEGVLPTIEHARAHLLTPEAQVIPRRASAIGYLVGGDMIEAQIFASRATPFDLSAFDQFAPSKIGLHIDRIPHDILSADFEIFDWDLMESAFPAERKTLDVTAIRAGRCVGVAQWLRLELDSETAYENRPDPTAGANGWMHVLYRLQEPLDLVVGQTVRLVAAHNRLAMTVALDA